MFNFFRHNTFTNLKYGKRLFSKKTFQIYRYNPDIPSIKPKLQKFTIDKIFCYFKCLIFFSLFI